MSQICSKNVFKIYSWPAGGSIAWGGAGGAVWSCFCPGGGGLGLAYSAKITHPSRNCIQKEEMWERMKTDIPKNEKLKEPLENWPPSMNSAANKKKKWKFYAGYYNGPICPWNLLITSGLSQPFVLIKSKL